jgi:AbrB family looped-hinge helix DNA binding protein
MPADHAREVILNSWRYDMASVVGTKGQLVIEKELRDKLGIKPGWKAFQRVVDGHLEIFFRAPASNRSLKGSLAPSPEVAAEVAGLTWDQIRERAWAAAAWETVARWGEQPAEQEEEAS